MDNMRTLVIALDRTTARDVRTSRPTRPDARVRRPPRLSRVLGR
jgi:hypothetical protein